MKRKISIGDFYMTQDGKSILAQVAYKKVALISLENGNRWDEGVDVVDPKNITRDEWVKMFDEMDTEPIRINDKY